eukprot:EG_transcript_51856
MEGLGPVCMHWATVNPAALAMVPPARYHHTAVLHGEELWVFGGTTSMKEMRLLNDLWVFSLSTRQWRPVQVAAPILPSPRFGHTAVVHGGKMNVFGGHDGMRSLNDMFELDLEAPSFK